jgi:hypothetical protein
MRGRMATRFLATSMLVLSLVTALATPASAGAVVVKNEHVGCFLDPGDIPGMPAIGLPEATLVLLPNGGVALSCHGWLPARLSLERTFAGSAPCRGPNGEAVEAHVVGTTSGRLVFICRFPPGSF